ncbi:MAG: T9SS type A sorting domain-containing protein [Bacteroidetes bacterium]|nr:T9SS type A sorting domain-containing protein [Bacteroidota bacterium]
MAAILLMTAGMLPEAAGQSLNKVRSVRAARSAAHALFGWRVDAHRDWAVIASPFEEVGGHVAAGRVYLHSAQQAWQQVQVVESPDPQAVHTFGMAVGLSDDQLAVGAPGDHGAGIMAGAVYVYSRSGGAWALAAKVESPEHTFGARFGGAVDIASDLLIVGAHRSFGSAERSGSVFVFRRDTTSWRLESKLFLSTAMPDEAFGTSLLILDDSTIVVGWSMYSAIEGRKEAVALFSRSSGAWSQTDLRLPPEGGADLFGSAIAANDRYIAVGVPGRTRGGVRSGGVMLYDRTTGLLSKTIENPDGSQVIYFGGSVSMTRDRLFVGCVQTGGKTREPSGKIAGYDLQALDSGPAHWFVLDDRQDLPHACPQVSATDSIVLASSPFSDVDGVLDAGMARFFPAAGVLGIEESSVPLEYALEQNYPNPFNASTRINFSLKAPGRVRMELFNMLGQRVVTLANEEMKEGRHFVSYDASSLASGLYFYRLSVNEFVALRKMLLIK